MNENSSNSEDRPESFSGDLLIAIDEACHDTEVTSTATLAQTAGRRTECTVEGENGGSDVANLENLRSISETSLLERSPSSHTTDDSLEVMVGRGIQERRRVKKSEKKRKRYEPPHYSLPCTSEDGKGHKKLGKRMKISDGKTSHQCNVEDNKKTVEPDKEKCKKLPKAGKKAGKRDRGVDL